MKLFNYYFLYKHFFKNNKFNKDFCLYICRVLKEISFNSILVFKANKKAFVKL